VFRRDAFDKVGGLSYKYEFAFDFDLFLKLTKIGKSVFIDAITSSHRWHSTSLTYSRRCDSVREASMARVSNLPKLAQPFSKIWEAPVVLLTYFAGRALSEGFVKKGEYLDRSNES
jgi:hypothetical protein